MSLSAATSSHSGVHSVKRVTDGAFVGSDGSVSIPFSVRQLDGIYDSGGFRSFVALLGNRDVDGGFLETFDKEAAKRHTLSNQPITRVVYDTAMNTVLGFATRIVKIGIDTSDVAEWLLARSAVVACTRLVGVPWFVGSKGHSVTDALEVTGLMLDVMSRVACRRTRDLAPLKRGDDDEVRSRGRSIVRDIVCGRGAAWMSMIDDLGCELCGIDGWTERRQAFATRMESHYVRAIIDAVREAHGDEISVGEARRIEAVQIGAVAGIADVRQNAVFALSFPDGVPSDIVDDDVSRRVFDHEMVGRVLGEGAVEGSDWGMARTSSDVTGGYFALFGTHPVDATFDMPEPLASEMRAAYDEAFSVSAMNAG